MPDSGSLNFKFASVTFIVHLLHMYMSLKFQGLGTDEHCLIEIMFTRTPAQILELKEAYQHGILFLSTAKRGR